MAGNPRRSQYAIALVAVNQDIKDVRGALKSCEDAQERRELHKRIMVLLKAKVRLLEGEALLADMAAGELQEVQQGCRDGPACLAAENTCWACLQQGSGLPAAGQQLGMGRGLAVLLAVIASGRSCLCPLSSRLTQQMQTPLFGSW